MKTTAEGARRPSSRSAPLGPGRWAAVAPLLVIGLVGVMLASGPTWGQNLSAPPSLKTIAVPQPENLSQFVNDKAAAIALGKALFWDMQVGSDAVQACASCHFNAGADTRSKNAVNPGQNAGDTTFQTVGPNGVLNVNLFPFTQFLSPDDATSPMIRSFNDIAGSQGVYNTTYTGQPLSGAVEQGTPVPDPLGFNVKGINYRRVEPRNAPTVINAVFNFNNFWDGRADMIFNGSSPFGDTDPDAGVWVNNTGVLKKIRVRIPYSSLASQAVGPPGSPMEMSFAGRTFPDIGKKLLNTQIVPLGKQKVHPSDSVLGSLAKSTFNKGRINLSPGLKTTYADMVRAAFNAEYWDSPNLISLPTVSGAQNFTQMEANFSLFFGLAVQLYEATLISDDSPYDRFMEGKPNAMSASAQEGLNIFLSVNEPGGVGGNCINCHGTSTFSNASVMHVGATNFGASLPEGLIERMIMGDFGGSWYDAGYYDVAVRPIAEDLGRGGTDPFGFPLSRTERALMVYNADLNGQPYPFPPYMDPALIATLPCGGPGQQVCPSDQRVATRGVFKVPTLRNVELTGPYMHNGGEATLMMVMDFYGRGGNFAATNISTFDPDVEVLCGLNANSLNPLCPPIDPAVAEANQKKVIDFLMALTDERVRWEQAPFDHPELFIPNGATKTGKDVLLQLPAIGSGGRSASGLGPVQTFLGLHPYYPNFP